MAVHRLSKRFDSVG
ncbi:hypothetical protein STRIP9103_07193, partial [Streptomyces ipomoeae 91-03]